MESEKNNWKDFSIYIGDRKIEGIKQVSFSPSLEKLKSLLQEAEHNEDYELCSELKKQIDNYKKQS